MNEKQPETTDQAPRKMQEEAEGSRKFG